MAGTSKCSGVPFICIVRRGRPRSGLVVWICPAHVVFLCRCVRGQPVPASSGFRRSGKLSIGTRHRHHVMSGLMPKECCMLISKAILLVDLILRMPSQAHATKILRSSRTHRKPLSAQGCVPLHVLSLYTSWSLTHIRWFPL